MISRRASSVPKEDVVFPRLLYCDLRCSQTCWRGSQACCRGSQTCCRGSQACRRRSQACSQYFQASSQRSQACHQRSQTCHRCSQDRCRRSQVRPMFSPALRGVRKLITITPLVLLYSSSEFPVTLKGSRTALPGSDTLLILTHLSLHCTSSQTLQEAPSD